VWFIWNLKNISKINFLLFLFLFQNATSLFQLLRKNIWLLWSMKPSQINKPMIVWIGHPFLTSQSPTSKEIKWSKFNRRGYWDHTQMKCTNKHKHTHTHVHILRHTHAHTHIHTDTYARTHAHTHLHTDTHKNGHTKTKQEIQSMRGTLFLSVY